MYTCNHCKKKFNNEPYNCSNKKKYCSFECIPQSGIDKPYSYQYFNLMGGIREIEFDIKNIKTLDDRIDLENKVEELSISYTLEIYGDYEGLFYKRQIGLLLKVLDELYTRVHLIFSETKYDSSPAVIINWDDLKRIIGLENATLIFDVFKDKIETFIFENVYLVWSDYKCRTIDFHNYEDKLRFATISDATEVGELFNSCFNECSLGLTDKQLGELDNYTNCIDINTLHRCVVCRQWELWERFTYYDNLKLYKCDEHCGCFEYDHLYQDEA